MILIIEYDAFPFFSFLLAETKQDNETGGDDGYEHALFFLDGILERMQITQRKRAKLSEPQLRSLFTPAPKKKNFQGKQSYRFPVLSPARVGDLAFLVCTSGLH